MFSITSGFKCVCLKYHVSIIFAQLPESYVATVHLRKTANTGKLAFLNPSHVTNLHVRGVEVSSGLELGKPG